MSSSHADTGICRTLTENDIYADWQCVYSFLQELKAGSPKCAAGWFVENYRRRRFENPSLMAHSSKSPNRRLSVVMSEFHSNQRWKQKVLEKGVQLWLRMEDKLSQDLLVEQFWEAEELEKFGILKTKGNLFQKLEEMCHEAVAELATDSELRIRKHQGKRGSLEISGKPFQKKDESGHEAVERQVTDSALPMRTQQGPHSTTQATSKRLTPVGTTSKCKIQDDDADPLYIIIDGKEYYNNGRKKGYLLILNSRENREGTEKDVANIRKFFKGKLRFEVDDPRSKEKADLSKETLTEYLKEAQDKLKSASASEYYCFVCIILSHGNEDGIATSNGIIAVEDIQKMFSNDKVQRFAGKPKLFFIQACRGSKGEGYVTAGEKADNIQEADDIQEDEADEIIKIPHEADTLVAYATAKGKLAIRDVKDGTWFIYEIIKEFEKNYTRDHVEEMLITVRQRVASKYSKKLDCMQMPCVQSTLTRRIKFD